MKRLFLLGIILGMSWKISAQLPEFTYITPQFYKLGKMIPTLQPTNKGGEVTGGFLVSTLAGNGSKGTNNAEGVLASFNQPSGVAIDKEGNLFVADQLNHQIRKISKNGIVTSFAGSGKAGFKDGNQSEAMFYYPTGIALDKDGNLFVADTYNHRIRKISPDGIVSTIAGSGKSGNIDGQSNNACFNFPMGVVSDNSGNIFVADFGNCTIREISKDGNVSTFAGSGFISDADGTGTEASFNYPTGITIDNMGNLFVADRGNNKIKKITPTQTVTTFTGNGQSGQLDGSAEIAQFNNPYGITIDQNGNLYVTDADNNSIRKITTTGNVSTITGQGIAGSADGFVKKASLNSPSGIAVDTSGVIIFADQLNNKIRQITRSPLYKITPELSSGLYFDKNTGSISGTPEATAPTITYTVTGTNDYGSYQTKINITVYDTLIVPTITTQAVSDITSTTVVGHGTLENLGMPNPTSYGMCWNNTGTPTIEDQHTDNGNATDTGAFVSAISDLAYNTTYYVRAYATNEAGTSYGNEVSFITKKCQLTANAPVITLSKIYDATAKASIDLSGVQLSNLADNDQVTLSGAASYDNKNAGSDKKITVSYTISGPDAFKYIAPENYVSNSGEITPIALTGVHAIANNKIYDGNTSVNISDIYPIGVIDGDQVAITINNAQFPDKNVGLNKSVIIPELSITGSDANNYSLPQTPSINASITKRQLTIESLVTTNKMYDATTTANIISIGTLSNLINGDDIQISAQANYDSPEIGSNKLITVTYILSGKDTANYEAPKPLVISNAIISDKIAIQSLTPYAQECETSSFNMDYVIQSGSPVQYKIIFNDNALSAGFTNIEFSDLSTTANNGTLTISIPQGAKYGNYSGTLIMKNVLGIESAPYPFNFRVDVSSGQLITKFGNIILIDNTENDFTAYQWFKNGNLIAGATDQYYYDPNQLDGIYSLQVTTKDGSIFNTCPKVINKMTASQPVARVFPNPLNVNQSCSIVFEGMDQKDIENTDITISNTEGKVIYTLSKVEKINTLNLSLPTGVYIGQAKSEKGFSQTFKLIITK